MRFQPASHLMGWAVIVIAILSIGLFFYTEWELKRFQDSLPEVPKSKPVEVIETVETADNELPAESELLDVETPAALSSPGLSEQVNPDLDEPVDVLQEDISESAGEYHQSLEENPQAATPAGGDSDRRDVAMRDGLPYDVEIVKAGFDDYNAYLETDPTYAYQRLDEAFREQYGDSSDVDTLVQTIQRGNQGTATIDDTIAFGEALLRLIPLEFPIENTQTITEYVEYLKEAKRMSMDTNVTLPISQEYHVDSRY